MGSASLQSSCEQVSATREACHLRCLHGAVVARSTGFADPIAYVVKLRALATPASLYRITFSREWVCAAQLESVVLRCS